MSSHQRGNKEAKKPKKAQPPALPAGAPPVAGVVPPAPRHRKG